MGVYDKDYLYRYYEIESAQTVHASSFSSRELNNVLRNIGCKAFTFKFTIILLNETDLSNYTCSNHTLVGVCVFFFFAGGGGGTKVIIMVYTCITIIFSYKYVVPYHGLVQISWDSTTM